jgi:hypothetical protein
MSSLSRVGRRSCCAMLEKSGVPAGALSSTQAAGGGGERGGARGGGGGGRRTQSEVDEVNARGGLGPGAHAEVGWLDVIVRPAAGVQAMQATQHARAWVGLGWGSG